MSPQSSRHLAGAASIWAKPRAKRPPPPFGPRVPAWARALIIESCAEAGVPLPHRTNWRVNARESSSGKHRYQIDPDSPTGQLRLDLTVSAGTDLRDARHVLVHELAHFLDADLGAKHDALLNKARPRQAGQPAPRQDPHDEAFFRRAIPLFARYGEFTLAEAIEREVKTYPKHRYDLVSAAVALGHSDLIDTVRTVHAAQRRARRLPPIVEVPLHNVIPVRKGGTYACAGCGRRLGKASLASIAFAKRAGLAPLQHQIVRFQNA
jgi:hypothetical protein